jgi:hypothetical protein
MNYQPEIIAIIFWLKHPGRRPLYGSAATGQFVLPDHSGV